MAIEFLDSIADTLLRCTLPGGAGGLVSFFLAMKQGHYRHNRYVAKCTIEIGGAMITASFISIVVPGGICRPVVTFAIGVAWAGIIQLIRKKITSLVEAALGERFDGRQ